MRELFLLLCNRTDLLFHSELRSPLHRILGSTELLAEHHADNTTVTLIEQIDSCGHTLLEVIDHLLDFSNLKNQRLKRGTVKSSKIGPKFLPTAEGASVDNDLTFLHTGVSSDEVTEDAIVSSVYSYHYNDGAEPRTQTSVILDIDRSVEAGWRCQLSTGGWKRVCINLVINALKYTPFGYVRVTLKQKARPGPRRRFEAVLTVTDSGIGMSKDFQKNHIFRDFSPADTLSSGLGLGKHMVSRMVNAMGGKIGVTGDQKCTATRVAVGVQLDNRQNRPERKTSADSGVSTAASTLAGVSIGLITEVVPPPVTQTLSLPPRLLWLLHRLQTNASIWMDSPKNIDWMTCQGRDRSRSERLPHSYPKYKKHTRSGCHCTYGRDLPEQSDSANIERFVELGRTQP